MRTRIALVLAVLLLGGFSAEVWGQQCNQNGGPYTCQPAIKKGDPSFTWCPDAAPTLERITLACQLNGGYWDGNNCWGGNGGLYSKASDASSKGKQFEDALWKNDGCGAGAPVPCSNYYCDCTTTTRFNIVEHDYTLDGYSGGAKDPVTGICFPWFENVVIGMSQAVGCPEGSSMGGGDEPDTPCVVLPPCDHCAGNPVDVGNGAKIQRETDYASPAPGGLRFERYFTSNGYFDFSHRQAVTTDFWRHSYSARIVPYSANAYVMAIAQRADGRLRPFNLSGAEMQNNDGAAYTLQKLVDGNNNVIGWQLTTADFDVEAYDAQGRLTSITTRAGFVTTVAYNASGQVSTVMDTYGRSLSLAYDASGNLSTMTDPAGRAYQYGYDTSGRLASVTYPDLSVRTYVYEDTSHPFLMTGIIDERNVRFATWAYDSNGRAIDSEHAGGVDKYAFTITDAQNSSTTQAVDAFNTTRGGPVCLDSPEEFLRCNPGGLFHVHAANFISSSPKYAASGVRS